MVEANSGNANDDDDDAVVRSFCICDGGGATTELPCRIVAVFDDETKASTSVKANNSTTATRSITGVIDADECTIVILSSSESFCSCVIILYCCCYFILLCSILVVSLTFLLV